ncbi:Uncharacterised protein [Vibrio cholerae]|nr:Uncharacterised protein [Vibrio cholerae]CSA25389.1 Uncharacterised protein [Vibrio cholerae]CSA72636.1 Uncharacterised protein [Vibrio cholerae]CSB68985.1 Uncharacterised protein [Vibrio cholerae]
MAIRAYARIRESHTLFHLYHRRHFFQIDLVHDAVTGGDHADVFKRGFTPFDKVEAIFVASVFHRTVFLKRIRIAAGIFHRQRVIDNQLSLDHRIDLRGVAALFGNRITQACQINQRGLAENIVAHHARGIPREIKIAFTLDNLQQTFAQLFRWAAANQVFGQNTCRVRQSLVCARF